MGDKTKLLILQKTCDPSRLATPHLRMTDHTAIQLPTAILQQCKFFVVFRDLTLARSALCVG